MGKSNSKAVMEKTASEPDFEKSLKRLEDIVETLEGGNSSLDDSIRLYEEGMALAKSCSIRLSDAKLKLKKIQKSSGGDLEETDIEE